MKKNIFRISIAVFFLAVVAACIFACNKEKVTKETNAYNILEVNTANMTSEEYELYIQELIKNTGIDIYEISKLNSLNKIYDKHQILINAIERYPIKSSIQENSFTDSIHYYYYAIENAYNQGNDQLVYTLFAAMSQLFYSDACFSQTIDENGWETIVYDPDKDPILAPTGLMQELVDDVTCVYDECDHKIPEFKSLPTKTKDDIVMAAMYVRISNDNSKYYSTEDCKKNALKELNCTLNWDKALFVIAAALCTTSGVLATPCYIVACASYMCALEDARNLYEARIRLCETQGYY